MGNICVSLFASAVRPAIWPALFKSLKNTSVSYEVVFSGNCGRFDILKNFSNKCVNTFSNISEEYSEIIDIGLKYIKTKNIKPAQCYEIARRACTGETVVWVADDCEFNNDVIGKAYKYWKSQNNEKLILSIQTAESGYYSDTPELYDMNQHRFYGGEAGGQLMAPIALMSRKFLDELGGLDKRFICGQYENQIIMRAYQHGGTVEIFGDKDCYVEIDHLKKSKDTGESTNKEEFINRPFARGYESDRKVLEASWTTFDMNHAFKLLDSGFRATNHVSLRKIHDKQLDEHQPYSADISLTKSEGNNLTEMWD